MRLECIRNRSEKNQIQKKSLCRTTGALFAGTSRRVVSLLTLAAALMLFGCSTEVSSDGQEAEMAYETGTLSMGTGEESTLVHQAGIAVANVINNTVPGIHVAVETTKGSMINASNVSEGVLDLALISGDVAYDAVNGEYSFNGEPLENLRVLGACYQEVSGWMALKKSGLTQVNELNGKIISSGSKASATELVSNMVYERLGIDSSDTEIYNDSLSNSVAHIKRETADAVHAFSAVPQGAHEALAAEYETVVLGYTDDELQAIVDGDARYFKTEIPEGTYNGQEEAVPTFGTKILLCASADMDEDLAYEIARALDLNGPTYVSGHRFMEAMLDETFLCNDLPIQLHDGAKTYYRELGFLQDNE